MGILEHRTILMVHEAVVSVGLASSRETLMSGIDASIRAGIGDAHTPGERLLMELTFLNDLALRSDQDMPLLTWLDNALRLIPAHEERARDTLQRLQKRLRGVMRRRQREQIQSPSAQREGTAIV